MDKKKLHGKIVEKYGTQTAFAQDVMGMNRSYFSTKMGNDASWTPEQITKVGKALDLTPDDVLEIFFPELVEKKLNPEA